ncbi:VRR-NUC domain-containing protein [Zhongshania arctica]|uniref:phosphodiesterase I n=1 Tax=Zhongshania arctica TaxID=3238302 RepID=A0ABV3TZQ9_9GAMM
MQFDTQPPILSRASLEDPLYYLENLHTVIHWVSRHHCDLLQPEELNQLSALVGMPLSAQALLARMVMRKGDIFRVDTLQYDEIPSTDAALDALEAAGFVDQSPNLDVQQLYQHSRHKELQALLTATQHPPAKSARKIDLLPLLLEMAGEEQSRSLKHWWPQASFTLVALKCDALMDRVRLMFFGNLHQDWSEFVLAELGHQVYETVDFKPESRAFRHRQEVDQYLTIHTCYSHLANEVVIPDILPLCSDPIDNAWLEHRRQRLLFQLAQYAERSGENALATTIYAQSSLDEAQVRYFRLLEKNLDDASANLDTLENAATLLKRPEAQLHLARIVHRLRRKSGIASKAPLKRAIPSQTLTLANTGRRVEAAVLEALASRPAVTGFYTENWLFTGLFGLLLWPVLYTPLPGAFFHPFQSGPADLFRPDFGQRRSALIKQRLASLDTTEYRSLIMQCWREKQGIACKLIHWSALNQELIELALDLIPADHLKTVFQHLLTDLRHHRRGMPDLIFFDQYQRSYELVEVKGPGDRLQDHQRLWIESMLAAGLPVSIAEVVWQPRS